MIKIVYRNKNYYIKSFSKIINSIYYDDIELIDCSYNNLLYLPRVLPLKLKILHCNNNNLRYLPVLPDGLFILDCSYNNLVDLPYLPDNLKRLYCNNNKLKVLPYINKNLEILYCSNNLLDNLPKLPKSLNQLYCSKNNIIKFKNNIILLTNLRVFLYDDNIELTEQQKNFMKFIKNNNSNKFYTNTQNVHDSNIQKCLFENIKILMNDKTNTCDNYDIGDDEVNKLIEIYFEDETVHSLCMVTYKQIFEKVWERIQKHSQKDELIIRLKDEILDGKNLCFTGRLTRLVNSLVHYYDDIKIEISESTQLTEKINAAYNVILKKYPEENDKFYYEWYKLSVKYLKELKISNNKIKEWTDHIKSMIDDISIIENTQIINKTNVIPYIKYSKKRCNSI